MAKKRKASRQPEAPSGPREYDAKDSRLGPINTFEDIADEQEEYFLDKDRISLEDERGTKRQRQQQQEEEFIDLSDDEVFRRDSDDSANESGEDDGERRKQKKKDKKAKAKKAKAERAAKIAEDDEDDEADAKVAGGEDDSGWWGSSKEHYYDGEVIETEDGAMEEEAEARRLQKKQLSRMKASDFFDADEWTTDAAATTPADQDTAASAANGAAASGPAGAVTMTILSKSEIDSMTGEERYKLLQEHYPELDHLCDEFTELEPLASKYKELAVGKTPETLEVIQFRAISCYVATIALYFSILMAPSRDDPSGPRYVMDPDELHNHEVMEYLVVARNNWEWVKRVQARRAAKASKEQKLEAAAKKESALSSTKDRLQLLDTIPEMIAGSKLALTKKKKAKSAKEAEEKDTATKKEKKSKRASAVSQEVEDSLADLANLIPKKGKKAKKLAKASKKSADSDEEEGHSDLGEEETIDARTADEKLKRKKSLGFYTSQIMQKSSMRSGATGQGGGDVDIPYRERLRDRQERLHAAAVRRGLNEAPNELGGDDDDDDGDDDGDNDDNAKERDANLSYYDSIVNAHKEKMAAKEARKAESEAMKLNRVTPSEWADKDGRRQLTWEIEKNKGLSHRTLKEKKNNPRVKKRIKFEKKKKQLASMRATYKPMNPSDYQGERTGIKTGLVRSIKLD